MELAHPEMLAWLWLLPVAAALLWLGQRRRLRRLEQASGLTVAGGGPSAWGLRPGRTLLKGALITLALAALALGLAQPRWGFQWTEVRHKGADLVVAVDVSSSMLARDVDPSRLERAKREVLDLLDTLHGDRVGLVAFAGDAFVECPLTEDYGAVRLFLNYLDPELIPLQGTDLGAAIETSLRALDAGGEGPSATGKAILLVTDGEDLEGHVDGPAQAAKQAGVRIYTVGIGSKEGAPIPDADGGFKKDAQGNVVITRPDEAALEKLALTTGGMFARSTAAKPALVELYDQGISKTLEQGELRTTRQKVWFDRFQWCLGLALLLLVIESCLRDVGVGGAAAAAADGSGGNSGRQRAPRGRAAALWVGVALGLLALGALARSAFAATPSSPAPAGPGPDASSAPAAAKPGAARVEAPAKSYNEAVGRFRSGDYDAAADGFTKAAQAEDQTLAERSYYDLGNAEVGRNHLQDAVKAYESALALNPEDADAKDNLNFVKKLIERQQEDERSRKQNQQQSQQNQQAQQNQQNQQSQGQQGQQNQQASQGQQSQQNQQASQGQQNQQQQQGQGQQNQQNQQGQGQQSQQSQQQGSQSQQNQQASQGQQPQQNQPQGGQQQNQQSQGTQGQQPQANQQAQQNPQDQQRQQGNQGQQPQDQQRQQGGQSPQDKQASQGQQPQGQDKQDQQRQQGHQPQGQSPQMAQNEPQGQKPQQGGGADAKDRQGGGADDQTQGVRNDGPGQSSPMTPEEAENVLRTVDDNVKKHLFAPKAKGRPQHLEKDW